MSHPNGTPLNRRQLFQSSLATAATTVVASHGGAAADTGDDRTAGESSIGTTGFFGLEKINGKCPNHASCLE